MDPWLLLLETFPTFVMKEKDERNPLLRYINYTMRNIIIRPKALKDTVKEIIDRQKLAE